MLLRMVIAAGQSWGRSSCRRGHLLPGRHVTDHQMRLFMQSCQTNTVAAAKALMSPATGIGLPPIRACHR